jgi:hypothetical protein
MARRVLQIVSSPEQILVLTPNELARALLEDMQAREQDPTGGMAKRDSLGALISPANFNSIRQNPRELQNQLEKTGRNAYALLERSGFIEADQGVNGMNGYLLLTPKGRATTELVDFERVRIRSLLKQEMLHSALRGKVYADFAADEFDSAVLEAFKTVEIEVRKAASLPEREQGNR